MSPPSVFKVESQIPEMLFKPKIRVLWSRSFSLDEQKVSLMTSTVMWWELWELYTSLPLNCGYFGSCWFWRLPFTVALWSDTVASCFFFSQWASNEPCWPRRICLNRPRAPCVDTQPLKMCFLKMISHSSSLCFPLMRSPLRSVRLCDRRILCDKFC